MRYYLLKDSSFWDIKSGVLGSWIWRKLLKLRPLVYNFIHYEVRNGQVAFFWFDDWLNQGKLVDIVGASSTHYFGLQRGAKVADAVRGDVWGFRRQRGAIHQELGAKIRGFPVPRMELGDDVVLRKHREGEYKEQFSASSTWE